MHEMSLAEGILDIVEDTARAQGASRVLEITLEIGALAGVEVDALRFCLDAILHDSVAADARVSIERLPGRGWCLACANEVEIAQLYDPCPRCGAYQVTATAGRDMRVKDLLLE
jgi:hydrogenase nickel incorporation protein HypA/HybF